ncbi:hypothetical protein Hdeb2414_s0003g00083201 [Helianthus debilis subsp. tardiflorus]
MYMCFEKKKKKKKKKKKNKQSKQPTICLKHLRMVCSYSAPCLKKPSLFKHLERA